jgi:prepilin-type processing-associated H-X9-DG protein
MPAVLQFAKSNNPSKRIVWADALLLSPYSNNAGSTNFMPGNTHAREGTAIPKGTNSAFIDGHVEWRNYQTGVNTMNMSRQYFLYFNP